MYLCLYLYKCLQCMYTYRSLECGELHEFRVEENNATFGNKYRNIICSIRVFNL